MNDKHGGCFVCGGGAGEILISVPDYQDSVGKARCRTCFELPVATLRKKFNAIAEAKLEATRKLVREAAHGA